MNTSLENRKRHNIWIKGKNFDSCVVPFFIHSPTRSCVKKYIFNSFLKKLFHWIQYAVHGTVFPVKVKVHNTVVIWDMLKMFFICKQTHPRCSAHFSLSKGNLFGWFYLVSNQKPSREVKESLPLDSRTIWMWHRRCPYKLLPSNRLTKTRGNENKDLLLLFCLVELNNLFSSSYQLSMTVSFFISLLLTDMTVCP